MDFKLKKSALSVAVMLACGLGAQVANAGATINFGEDKYITAGFGFISTYKSSEDGAASGSNRSNDFALNSARINLSGSFNKYIKGMLNTERDIAGTGSNDLMQIIDANVQFQLTPEVAIWAGRFLSPSDRANMAGPYYSSGGGVGYWSGIASRYGFNGGVIGRDEGVAVVSSLLEDHLAISFGAFEGDNIFKISPPGVNAQSESSAAAKALGAKDNLMYAGRVQYAFWDAEPGYYGTGNYFGAKDILTVGIAARQKSDGAISTTKLGDYTSYSVDFLMEKKNVGPGTLSLEAAYYDYDTDKVFLMEEGTAYSVGAGYLFDTPVGWGKLMPFARHQAFDAENNVKTARTDVGVNYVIAPYNALISAEYQKTDVTGKAETDAVLVTLQMQF